MNIGFDLDRVFINFPPLVPSQIIDLLYKGKKNHELKYRIPSKTEQIIRSLTHHPVLRKPILENINYVKSLSSDKNNKCYLISSRFGFLKGRTNKLIKTQGLNKIFKEMYFNYSNQQPHYFKDKIIKKLDLKMYVDDDLDLLTFLSPRNPKIIFLWLNNKKKKKISKNLFAIKKLSDIK